MPCSLHIVKTSDFVRLHADGRFDFESSKKVLASVARACLERGVDCALIDIRDAERSLKIEELYRLAQAFQEVGFRQNQRLAVLHRYNAAERAEIFAMFAHARGWNVRAFDHYEEAIEWFTSTAVPVV